MQIRKTDLTIVFGAAAWHVLSEAQVHAAVAGLLPRRL